VRPRSTRERAAEPVNWPAAHSPRVLVDDYDLDNAGFMPKGAPATWTADAARASMAASYPRMLTQFNGQYRRMFGELVAGHAPLAFNCSAGKDRTGIGAALLLTALGVPRETVIEDYLLTNTTLNPATVTNGKASAGSPWAILPPDVLKAFMGADRRYIEAALTVVDGHRMARWAICVMNWAWGRTRSPACAACICNRPGVSAGLCPFLRGPQVEVDELAGRRRPKW
jgi:protein-tyrosine phosphatase